jgi:hypothetical protein
MVAENAKAMAQPIDTRFLDTELAAISAADKPDNIEAQSRLPI